MDLQIGQKRALVLAAAGGLGCAVSRALAAEGCNLILTDRDVDGLCHASEALARTYPVCVKSLPCDFGSPASVQEMIDAALGLMGGIDILVNITGGPPAAPIDDVDDQALRAHFESMVLSVIGVTKRVLPGMRASKWGRIITSTSSGVVQPIPNLGVSNTLRAALVTWSKTLSVEVASDGVTVNVLVPGRIHTRRVEQLDRIAAAREGRSVEDVVSQSQRSIPLQRYGRPEEFASVAAFLASGPASYITGSIIRVDGGLIRSI